MYRDVPIDVRPDAAQGRRRGGWPSCADQGRLLRQARQRAGLSQQLLGLMTGTTQQAVSRWEKGLGSPEAGTRRALGSILDLPRDFWGPDRRAGPAATEPREAQLGQLP